MILIKKLGSPDHYDLFLWPSALRCKVTCVANESVLEKEKRMEKFCLYGDKMGCIDIWFFVVLGCALIVGLLLITVRKMAQRKSGTKKIRNYPQALADAKKRAEAEKRKHPSRFPNPEKKE